jgi:hypothetical protein
MLCLIVLASLTGPAPDRPWLADADALIPTPHVRLGRAGVASHVPENSENRS